MAKGIAINGMLRGKIGGTVYYRTAGEQISRAYNGNPKNANTAAQAQQRTKLANLVNLYRVAQKLLNHSFTTRAENRSSYNEFVSKNIGRIDVYLPKAMAAADGCVVAPYLVSSGSLQPIQISGEGANAVTDLVVGSLEISETTTVAEFSQALIENNSQLVAGMQLSYISLVQSNNPGTGYPSVQARLYELTFDLTDSRPVYDIMPKQAVAVKSNRLAHGEQVADGGFCWIISQKSSTGKLNASQQALIVTSAGLYTAYTSNTALTRAAESYKVVADPFLVPGGDSTADTIAFPSVSVVTVAGNRLTSNDAAFQISASQADAASVNINGTDLAGITSVSLKLNNTTIAMTTPAATATLISGTIAVPAALQGVDITNVSVILDGVTSYTWNAAISGGGNTGGNDGGGDDSMD